MKYAITGSRLLLGLIFVVFGLNGFFHFIPMPPPAAEMGAFAGALFATGYFFPFLKIVEIIAGLFLLTGFYVPLGLVLLAPITLNILLVHAFLDPAGAPMGVLVVGLNAFLGFYAYRNSFKAILAAKADPVTEESR